MRYKLEAKEPDKHICIVGYDKAHKTFFVYVANKGKTDRDGRMAKGTSNHVVIWFGTAEREITTVEEVKRLVTPYAKLPADIERALGACIEEENDTTGLAQYQGAKV